MMKYHRIDNFTLKIFNEKLKKLQNYFYYKDKMLLYSSELTIFPCFPSSSSIRNKTDFRLFWFFLS